MFLKKLTNVWHLWNTTGHQSKNEFCQAIDTSDFNLECAEIFLRKFCWQRSNVKRKFQAILGFLFKESDRNIPSVKDERLRDIGHKMSMIPVKRKSNFGSHWWLWFHISSIMALCHKKRQILLQNASAFLLQYATVLLQNAVVFTKWDVYYKMRRYTPLCKASKIVLIAAYWLW